MNVNVTEKHIRKGVRRQPRLCPIALALKEQMHREIEAGPLDLFYLVNKRVGGEAITPDLVARFMRNFDVGRPVKPFTFEVSFQAMKGMK